MITVRQLRSSPETLSMLQAVLEAAPTYSLLTSGELRSPGSAKTIFEALPPGKSSEDKFVLGIYEDRLCVGLLDLIRGYPNAYTAMIGLLLISESHHGRGIGRAAYAQLEALVCTWPLARSIRIGVVGSNARVLPFWQGLGFSPTGTVKPYLKGSVISTVVVLERALEGAAS